MAAKEWNISEYVTYDDAVSYMNHSGEWTEKNYQASIKKGFTYEQLCPYCNKPITGEDSFVTMNECDGKYYYNRNAPGTPFKIGKGCFKAFKKAHDVKYKK